VDRRNAQNYKKKTVISQSATRRCLCSCRLG